MKATHRAQQRGQRVAPAVIERVGEGVECGRRELRELFGGHDVLLVNGLFAVPSQPKEPDSP
jgi:hypothetical protein